MGLPPSLAVSSLCRLGLTFPVRLLSLASIYADKCASLWLHKAPYPAVGNTLLKTPQGISRSKPHPSKHNQISSLTCHEKESIVYLPLLDIKERLIAFENFNSKISSLSYFAGARGKPVYATGGKGWSKRNCFPSQMPPPLGVKLVWALEPRLHVH